ncbi:MAG: hypothetical protein L6R28_02145 [Planctomycetes bacterium]|nr:hypothetical protein [Planctomycetota bacterium]
MCLRLLSAAGLALILALAGAGAGGAETPAPRIESVEPAARQPQAADAATIWFDDFDGAAKDYAEAQGDVDAQAGFGGRGGALACVYEKGEKGTGNRKVFFGDSPTYRNKAVRKGEKFTDVYWRIYVKHQPGWTGGGPTKMSRATSLVSENWKQAMIAHVWSSGEALTLDPASGIKNNAVVTTKYNDFPNLRWLGNKPASDFKIHSTAESGWWVRVESRAKLNAPGRKDGLNQLWIDGRLAAERKDLDWTGGYAGHGINAVFLEAYWNQGSPVTQRRWYDNFVVSTKPIGPVVCPRNPVLLRTPPPKDAALTAWQAEVASGGEGKDIVWRSKEVAKELRVAVDAEHGAFDGTLKGEKQLAAEAGYFVRIREKDDKGAWVEWSRWHQHFATEK